MTFSPAEEKFVKAMRLNVPRNQLFQIISQIDVNAYDFFVNSEGVTTDTTYSLLMYASHYACFDGFDLLVHRGADMDWCNNRGTTVFEFMAKRDQIRWLNLYKRYLESSDQTQEDLSEDGNFGPDEKYLLGLIKKKNPDTEKLRKAVQNVNVNAYSRFITTRGERSTTTYSLLMYASHNNAFEAFKMLISHGADLKWQNNRGTTVYQFMEKRNQHEWLNYCKKLEEDLNEPIDCGSSEVQSDSDDDEPGNKNKQRDRYEEDNDDHSESDEQSEGQKWCTLM